VHLSEQNANYFGGDRSVLIIVSLHHKKVITYVEYKIKEEE
jgi:hypothetical protein